MAVGLSYLAFIVAVSMQCFCKSFYYRRSISMDKIIVITIFLSAAFLSPYTIAQEKASVLDHYLGQKPYSSSNACL